MDYIMGMIEGFAGTFVPMGWMGCNGQLLSISQYPALYSIIGTTYGGNGTTTFALPNLNGSVPVGAQLSNRTPPPFVVDIGEQGGTSEVTLIQAQLPVHSHVVFGTTVDANTPNPTNSTLMANANDPAASVAVNAYNNSVTTPLVHMSGGAIQPSGGSQPHDNMMPTSVVQYCICVKGYFPQRG